jgi:hypothetical protein
VSASFVRRLLTFLAIFSAVFIAVSATAPIALAAPRTQSESANTAPLSIREEALRENSTVDTKAYRKSIQASEAQQANVESFLKLEDPAIELRDRPWLWLFSFKVESLKPEGSGHVADTRYPLNTYGAGVMPSIDFGMLYNAFEKSSLHWTTGLGAHAGIMSQTTEVHSSSGYVYKDARLNTTVVSGVWHNRISLQSAPKWTALVNPEYGVINYTQSSVSSSLANFSQQNSFWGLGLGAEYAVSRKWNLAAQFMHRTASAGDVAVSDIQNDNLEIGTTVVW